MNMPTIDDLMQIVPPLVGTFMMVWCGWIVFRAVIVPRGLKGAAACGRCGHGIGLPVPERCQECGSELLVVGVSTPSLAARLRGGTIRVVLAWLLFSFFAGVFLRGVMEGALMGVLPRNSLVRFDETYTIVPTGPLAIGPYSLTVSGRTIRPAKSGGPTRGTIWIVLGRVSRDASGLPEELIFTFGEAGSSVRSSSPGMRLVDTDRLTEADASQVLRRVDPVISGETLAAYSKALAAMPGYLAENPESPHSGVNRALEQAGLAKADSNGGRITTSSVYGLRLPRGRFLSAAVLAWVPTGLLMLIGAVWVARRHRRLTSPMRMKIPA